MSRLRSLLLATFGLLACACGPEFDHAEITGVKATRLGGDLTNSRLVVPEGLIVKAHVVMWNDDREAMRLDIRSADPTMIQVAGVVNEHDYAFVGLRAGRTQVELRAEGVVVLTIDAEVTPQPAP